MGEQLHKAQVSILNALRHSKASRFSMLMRPTGMESDTFKFHVRKLAKLGYVEKAADGSYRLTAPGKEFANNLDEATRRTQRQPKLSLLIIVRRADKRQPPQYLFQQRKRNPYYNFWSCIGGPAHWGEDFEVTAAKELKKQTGLDATCIVRSFFRCRDYDATDSHLLEDKLFVVLEAVHLRGTINNDWYAGHNAWMTLNEYRQQEHYFGSVLDAIDMLEQSQPYASQIMQCSQDEY
jgi:ADP-ribose pyrophosphatase YjhB (NUDIX family)/predicted transcriptional regulator